MSDLVKNNFEIDAVITWVDGSDVVWRNKINTHLEKKIDWNNKVSSKRYNSIDEIELTIESIIKFAPFIRTIFIVTDNQKPKSFDKLREKSKKVNINLELVDHTVIFKDFENYLPTFNSCSIITALYRIPTLAEHFIIFNDDTLLMRDTKEEDFFINGLPVIRGRWDRFYSNNWFRKTYNKYFNKNLKTNVGYKHLQQKSAKIVGFEKKYVRRDHTPVSVRKSTLVNFFSKYPNLLENNIKHKFRNNDQFIISSLSNHIEIKNKTYVLKTNFQLTYFRTYKTIPTIFKLFWFDLNKKKLFVCLQSLELGKKSMQAYVLKWINKKIYN
jgi:hypothetical protein